MILHKSTVLLPQVSLFVRRGRAVAVFHTLSYRPAVPLRYFFTWVLFIFFGGNSSGKACLNETKPDFGPIGPDWPRGTFPVRVSRPCTIFPDFPSRRSRFSAFPRRLFDLRAFRAFPEPPSKGPKIFNLGHFLGTFGVSPLNPEKFLFVFIVKLAINTSLYIFAFSRTNKPRPPLDNPLSTIRENAPRFLVCLQL